MQTSIIIIICKLDDFAHYYSCTIPMFGAIVERNVFYVLEFIAELLKNYLLVLSVGIRLWIDKHVFDNIEFIN